MNKEMDQQNWIIFGPSGKLAIYREAVRCDLSKFRLATAMELLAANRGNPFPWGSLPEVHPNNRQWRKHRIGVGGLIHKAWFLTKDGRFGGAPNVPETKPGSLRSCMYLDGGGQAGVGELAENEGYAVVRETSEADQMLYRKVTLYSATHVMADGGAIVMSPITSQGIIKVGFVGRCQICPNAELISFKQLQKYFPEYEFELWEEWKDWSIGPCPEKQASETDLKQISAGAMI